MTRDTTGRPAHPNGVLYCNLMEQIKRRVDASIASARMADEKKHFMDDGLVLEFAILQARYCCELLALACVAIHTDKPETKRLEKLYNAGQIMAAFENAKPAFFPQAMEEVMLPNGVIKYNPVVGALTKRELTEIYSLSGNFLHVGSLKQFRKKPFFDHHFKQLDTFFHKLPRLLYHHHYFLDDGKRLIRVVMNNVTDGRVLLQSLRQTSAPTDAQ
jgi:hypothetical protein